MNEHSLTLYFSMFLFPVGILIGLVMAMYAKQQVFFQRAYVDVEGDNVDQIINIFKYDYEYKHVSINLISGLSWRDKEGKENLVTPFVRVSRMFIKSFIYSREREQPCETVDYLKKKLKKAGFIVSSFGYY